MEARRGVANTSHSTYGDLQVTIEILRVAHAKLPDRSHYTFRGSCCPQAFFTENSTGNFAAAHAI